MVFRRLLHDDAGSSAVQFAFVAPVLILLTLGIIDMGRLGLAATAMRNAAMDAARFASLRGAASAAPATVSAIAAVARDQAVGVPPSDLSVAVVWSPDNKPGSQVKVQLSYAFPLFISALMPIPDIQITRSSAMVIF
jgi:Flp pilus assembly protein TadG